MAATPGAGLGGHPSRAVGRAGHADCGRPTAPVPARGGPCRLTGYRGGRTGPRRRADSRRRAESLAAEGAALAARIEASGGADPSAVDPVLLREQELLAERARQLNTGLIAHVPSAAPAPAPAAAATPAPDAAATPVAPAAAQEPVQAQSAHGLDSLGASAWSSRERNLILAAGLVIVALLIALILALVL